MSESPPFEEHINKQVVADSETYFNVGQHFIITTEDKVRICLHNHEKGLTIKAGWVTPVSLAATILLALVTCNFHDFLTIAANTWQAVFVLGLVLAGLWSLNAIWKAWPSRASVEDIIVELRRDEAKTAAESKLHPVFLEATKREKGKGGCSQRFS